MSSTATHARAASDEELPRLLALIEDSDSVELKLTIPDGEQRSAMAALGLDPLDAQIGQVFFFRHPGPPAERERARRARAARPEARRRLGRQAPAGGPE